ncbi:hypothetical protein BC939DRAFT_481011 [Gamsiella multidivaricata]|uniref:uncharacterized protein n=1 Tax=Gamsiella multidivaricata TaxID=101098 RepID=UPI00221E7685|nr:uncharacterized protein BC939DRAFT_481011 [Gamsiella multidivaricata]KAI7817614.1 hypothetical protein BC939DRAFT_481011 [Gamsiella multidivaricata]
MSRVRNAKSVSMNEDGSVVSLTKAHREKDLSEGRQLVIMKKIWKEQGAQSKLEKLEREDEKEAFEKYERRNTLFQSTRKLRRWTEEESKLLIKLVHKYREEPGIWGLVAGGTIEDDDGNMQTLARMGMSCKRQWVYLNRPEQIKTGYWSADEKQKLVEAIRKRVGNGFEITIDVLRTPGTTTAAKANKAKREQDKSTATTASTANSTTAIGADALERGKQKLLKMGGPELSSLNWLDIAAEVGTRDGLQCRNHFYANMHNGRRGHWTEEERRLFKEAYKKYGNQWRAIATHVGTRSSAQAKYAYQTIMGKE